MSDENTQPEPDQAQPLGWTVTDPDGNVVASGQMSIAQPAAWVSELLANASEGEQQ